MTDAAPLQWLYDDAIFMRDNGKSRGCLLLLLCLIDGLAKLQSPDVANNRDRYCKYLRGKLAEVGVDGSIRVEGKGGLVHYADLIYFYFRCYLVHEGDCRDDGQYEIQIEYEESGRFMFPGTGVLGDRNKKQIIIKADWLIELLVEVADTELKV